MSSSIEYGEKLRQTQSAAKATKTIKANLKGMDPRDILAASAAIRQLTWRLDKVPLTKDDRNELDLLVQSVALLFQETDTPES